MAGIESTRARLHALAEERGERLVVIDPAPDGVGLVAAFQGAEDEMEIRRFSAKARNEVTALERLLHLVTTTPPDAA